MGLDNKIANNESIDISNDLITKRKNQINFHNMFKNYLTLTNPNKIQLYLNTSDKLIGVDKSKIKNVTQHCISLFRKQNSFNGFKGAYSFSNSINDLNKMKELAVTSNDKLYTNKIFEYLTINKNEQTREKYFSFYQPKKDTKGSYNTQDTSVSNAFVKEIGKIQSLNGGIGQFGNEIMKELNPESSSYQSIRFNTTMSSLAKYGTYKVTVKWKLEETVHTKTQALFLKQNLTKTNYHYDTVTYIVKPKGKTKELVDFGKIQTGYAASSMFGIMGGSSESEFKGDALKYEIINIEPID